MANMMDTTRIRFLLDEEVRIYRRAVTYVNSCTQQYKAHQVNAPGPAARWSGPPPPPPSSRRAAAAASRSAPATASPTQPASPFCIWGDSPVAAQPRARPAQAYRCSPQHRPHGFLATGRHSTELGARRGRCRSLCAPRTSESQRERGSTARSEGLFRPARPLRTSARLKGFLT